MRLFYTVIISASLLMTSACQSTSSPSTLPLAENVDLERFMGDWYVIGVIPTPLEKNAYNALEQYALNEDGTIATTFTYNSGALDGPRRQFSPKGFVSEESNAIWKMQFLWPFKADYRVMYIAPDYSATVIGREKRDFAWIMARESTMSDEQYDALTGMLQAHGYDLSDLRRIPHSS